MEASGQTHNIALPVLRVPPSLVVPSQRKSHLPAWLLASTAAVEASRSERNLLEDRLIGLRRDVLVLDSLMDKEKSSYATILAARANAAMLRASNGTGDGKNVGTKSACEKESFIPRTSFGLHRLPVDITNIVAQFGGAKELAVFSMTSKKVFVYMSQDEAGWISLYHQHSLMIWTTCPGADLRLIPTISKKVWLSSPSKKLTKPQKGSEQDMIIQIENNLFSTIRSQVLHHASALARVLTFIAHLQETRSSKRTKDIKPKVYSRRDRDVSHPLPFLGVGGTLDDKIMSQANTMNKDTRQEALHVLEIMVLLSANSLDQETLSLLRRKGAMTVMIALLANESASIQELCCAAIANLMIISCSSLPFKREGGEIKQFLDVDPRLTLDRCNGRNPLVSLLTSPTARLNTVTSMPTNHLQGASNWRHESRLTTSFCMGMASKHASRALINAWCPSYAIPRSMLENSTEVPWAYWLVAEPVEKVDDMIGGLSLARESIEDDDGSYWMAYYFYSTGTEKDCSPIKIDLLPNGAIQGYGSDNLGQFVIKGKAQEVRMGSLTYNFTKTYTDRGNMPSDGHISHVAFWVGGSGDSLSEFGFWGIWEHVTGEPHFELDRGGVFRFVKVEGKYSSILAI